MQDDLAVSGGKITGTLKYLTTGQLVNDWGEGYFIAVGFSNFSSGPTYENVQVGLTQTEGSGLVTLDSDQDAVMHVTDPNQRIMAIQTDAHGHKRAQYWSLADITYEPKEGG